MSLTLLLAAASIMSSHCSRLSAIGFSTRTCLPALQASTVRRWCSWWPSTTATGVDLVIGQEIGVRGVALGNVVFVHVLAALLFEQIGDRDDLDVIEGSDGITVGGGNAAQSDDSDFQFVHAGLSRFSVLWLFLGVFWFIKKIGNVHFAVWGKITVFRE